LFERRVGAMLILGQIGLNVNLGPLYDFLFCVALFFLLCVLGTALALTRIWWAWTKHHQFSRKWCALAAGFGQGILVTLGFRILGYRWLSLLIPLFYGSVALSLAAVIAGVLWRERIAASERGDDGRLDPDRRQP
jgi:hypothetical protein